MSRRSAADASGAEADILAIFGNALMMQDLTTGSLTRHLLKTTSFMLVTMVFQTLYFLVDLYWVGRLGKEAVAAVGIAGNLTFIVLAITQMLGVGTTTLVSHAAGRKDHERAMLRVQPVAGAVAGRRRRSSSWSMMAMRLPYAAALGADAATARTRRRLPALVHSGDVAAVRDGRHGLGAARHRQLQARHGRPDRARSSSTCVLAPILIFGWGTGRPMGVAGAAISTLVAVVVGVGVARRRTSSPAKRTCISARRDWRPQLRASGGAC